MSVPAALSDLEIRVAGAADETVLLRMLELYQHDLSDIWDQDLSQAGLYGYRLEQFWCDPKCLAFLFLVGGHFAGFALVDGSTRLPANQIWMSQFFVLKKYRRQKLGARAARFVFDRVPGRWEVGQMAGNEVARTFWRETIRSYTAGLFVEQAFEDRHWHGTLMSFDNSVADGRPDR